MVSHQIILHESQKQVATDTHPFRVVCCGRQWGKALALDTPIPTADGWKVMGDIVVGDTLFDEKGNTCEVTYTSPIFRNHDCYEIVFSDGSTIVADAEHLWEVVDKNARKHKTGKKQVLKTSNMFENTRSGVESNYAILLSKPISLKEKELPIEPYVLGAWIGDGASAGGRIYVDDTEIINKIKSFGYEITKGADPYAYGILGLQKKLRKEGLLNKKRIPKIYLRSSVEQRMELLRGLMDTDGSVETNGRCEFTTIRESLALEVKELVESLGMLARFSKKEASLNGKNCGFSYRIRFTTDKKVFSLKRKLVRLGNAERMSYRYVVSINKVKSVPTKCIQVNSKSHLFLAGNFIPTHNTTLSVLEMVACAYAQGGREIAYFATTYDQARNIAWAMLKEVTEGIVAKTPNESRLELIIKARDDRTSRITLRGWENVETTRGQQFDFLVLDEVAQMRNFDYNWNAVLEPTLAFRRGAALFISTPLGFNHFNSMYERGQKDNPYWKSWKFTSYDNPYLPKERIEQAKITSTPEYFAQEYMGDFRKYVGLVYRTFDREVHTVDTFDILPEWQIYRTFDFGSTNPTACLWIAVDRDNNWWVVDEYYNSGQTIDYHCGVINANPLSKNVVRSYGDPSGAQWIQEFAQRGIYITPATKESNTSQPNWTRLGIEKIQEKLKVTHGHFIQEINKSDTPSLLIFKRCVNLIKEFETYRWKENIAGNEEVNEPDMPEKAYDHALDSLRYFAVSYQTAPQFKPTYQEVQDDKKWRIGK